MFLRTAFQNLEPTFYAGLFDDPLLLVRVRPRGRSLLFDCGQLHHLAKRAIKSIEAIFISHAHMDHFMGIDTFVRHTMVSGRTFEVFGPPGLAGRMAHKLGGYDWNLAEDFWSTLRVHEIHPERIERTVFAGKESFRPRGEGASARCGRGIYHSDHLRVEAELFDHRIPVLGFRIVEKCGFRIDAGKVAAAGLSSGPWLGELQKRFYAKELDRPISVPRNEGGAEAAVDITGVELYRRIRREDRPAGIGYLTDIGLTPENHRRAVEFFAGVTLFVCECTYLSDNCGKARRGFHLCSDDLNRLLDEIRPRLFLPMHLSKTYQSCSFKLYRELRPPAGTTLLRIPDHQTPRPLLPAEIATPHEKKPPLP